MAKTAVAAAITPKTQRNGEMKSNQKLNEMKYNNNNMSDHIVKKTPNMADGWWW